jgi:hypothetical protein
MQTAQREGQSAGRGYPASVRLDEPRSAVYTTNMATPAANIATVVIATTVHPKRDLLMAVWEFCCVGLRRGS